MTAFAVGVARLSQEKACQQWREGVIAMHDVLNLQMLPYESDLTYLGSATDDEGGGDHTDGSGASVTC